MPWVALDYNEDLIQVCPLAISPLSLHPLPHPQPFPALFFQPFSPNELFEWLDAGHLDVHYTHSQRSKYSNADSDWPKDRFNQCSWHQYCHWAASLLTICAGKFTTQGVEIVKAGAGAFPWRWWRCFGPPESNYFDSSKELLCDSTSFLMVIRIRASPQSFLKSQTLSMCRQKKKVTFSRRHADAIETPA